MARYELTEFEWKTIQPMLPNKPRGVPRVDDRRVLNGIFWVLRSGSPWADVPERYGPPTTVYNRFNRWRKAGVWDKLMDCHHRSPRRQGADDRFQHRARPPAGRRPKKQAGDACIGRSRGGLTTKLHLRVIGNGLPVQIELSPGQMNDQPMAELLLNDLPAGADVIADKGYDADWIRDLIEDQDCTPHIPPKSNRYDGITYSKTKYKKRNLIERCFNKLKQFRHIATRYDRNALNYLAMIKIACLRLWLRFYEFTA